MRVIGYVRVSTNEQAENGVSLAAQEQKIRGYCKLNDWQCLEVVRGDGYSAKDLKRPGLQRILDDLPTKGRRFDGIVVAKLDRLTRSVGDLNRLTELLLKQSIALVSIQEAVDTSTATGKMFYALVTVISEWERGVIGERTREALAYKRRNGECVGALPYGFKLTKDGKHLVPVLAEGKVLAQIKKERARKMSDDRIADGLNADRIQTKRGGRWYAMTVRSLLATARRRAAESTPEASARRQEKAGGPQARAHRAA
jgi:DNA invertase Pin-like site-specific DNA recombinase